MQQGGIWFGDEINVSDSFVLEISGLNDAPTLTNALVDQSSLEDEAFSFALPADSFLMRGGDTNYV